MRSNILLCLWSLYLIKHFRLSHTILKVASSKKKSKVVFLSNAKIINRHGLRVFILFSIEFPSVGSLDGVANLTIADDVSSLW